MPSLVETAMSRLASIRHLKITQRHTFALAGVLLALMVAYLVVESVGVIREVDERVNSEAPSQAVSNDVTELTFDANKLLFGQSKNSGSSNTVRPTTLNITLRGTLVNEAVPERASAIIQTGSSDKVYFVGERVSGGAVLAAVYGDHIVLERGGMQETLHFPEIKKDGRTGQAPAAAVPQASAIKPTLTEPPRLDELFRDRNERQAPAP